MAAWLLFGNLNNAIRPCLRASGQNYLSGGRKPPERSGTQGAYAPRSGFCPLALNSTLLRPLLSSFCFWSAAATCSVLLVLSWQIQTSSEVTTVAISAIQASYDQCLTTGCNSGVSGFFQLFPILSRILSAQVTGHMAIDLNANGFAIVRVFIVQNQHGSCLDPRTLLGTPATNRFQLRLIVRFANYFDIVSVGAG
jgi:hypothetical protein